MAYDETPTERPDMQTTAFQIRNRDHYDFACAISDSLAEIPFEEVKNHFFIVESTEPALKFATVKDVNVGHICDMMENAGTIVVKHMKKD